MVDALRRTHDVVVPGGTLVDLRPRAETRPLEAMTPDSPLRVGELIAESSAGDDAAADAAIAFAVQERWWTMVGRRQLDVRMYWDNAADLAAYLVGGRHRKSVRPACEELERMCVQLGTDRLRCERTVTLDTYRRAR
jgi:hypothetical protein